MMRYAPHLRGECPARFGALMLSRQWWGNVPILGGTWYLDPYEWGQPQTFGGRISIRPTLVGVHSLYKITGQSFCYYIPKDAEGTLLENTGPLVISLEMLFSILHQSISHISLRNCSLFLRRLYPLSPWLPWPTWYGLYLGICRKVFSTEEIWRTTFFFLLLMVHSFIE